MGPRHPLLLAQILVQVDTRQKEEGRSVEGDVGRFDLSGPGAGVG